MRTKLLKSNFSRFFPSSSWLWLWFWFGNDHHQRAGWVLMATVNTPRAALGEDGSAYFRSFLDSNRGHQRRATQYAAPSQMSPRSPGGSGSVPEKIAEATFSFIKRKTLFRPKLKVVAELFSDGFVRVYRTSERSGREEEMYIDEISLLLTTVKDTSAKNSLHGAFIFEIPGGKTFTFSYKKQDVNALDFLSKTKKLAQRLKINYENTLARAESPSPRRSTSSSPRHSVRSLSLIHI